MISCINSFPKIMFLYTKEMNEMSLKYRALLQPTSQALSSPERKTLIGTRSRGTQILGGNKLNFNTCAFVLMKITYFLLYARLNKNKIQS